MGACFPFPCGKRSAAGQVPARAFDLTSCKGCAPLILTAVLLTEEDVECHLPGLCRHPRQRKLTRGARFCDLISRHRVSHGCRVKTRCIKRDRFQDQGVAKLPDTVCSRRRRADKVAEGVETFFSMQRQTLQMAFGNLEKSRISRYESLRQTQISLQNATETIGRQILTNQLAIS